MQTDDAPPADVAGADLAGYEAERASLVAGGISPALATVLVGAVHEYDAAALHAEGFDGHVRPNPAMIGQGEATMAADNRTSDAAD